MPSARPLCCFPADISARLATGTRALERYVGVLMSKSTTAGEQALTALFHAQSARVHGLLLVRCGNPSIAEELTAQTFEAAARRFAAGRGAEVTPPWLTTVALRRLVDHWRSSGRTRRLVVRLGSQHGREESAPEFDDELWEALESLPGAQRVAITLRYLDDWSVAEIADGLGISYRAAESSLSRGRRSLRVALAAEEGNDGSRT